MCKNCGRKKPKYLGIKLNVDLNDKITLEQLAIWHLMVAYSYLIKLDEYLKEINIKLEENLKLDECWKDIKIFLITVKKY